MPQFELVKDEETATPAQPAAPAPDHAAAMKMIMLGLSTLGQRTLHSLAALFSLALAGSAFMLWWEVLPNPTTYQLIGLGLYALFILLLHVVKMRV